MNAQVHKVLIRVRGHRRGIPIRLGMAFVAGAVLLAACGNNSQTSKLSSTRRSNHTHLTTLNFNVYSATPYTELLYFAKSEGFFRRNGINANLVPTTSAPEAFSAVLGGTLEFASGDMINGGTYVDKGIPLEIVAGLMAGNQQLLIGAQNAHLPRTFPAGIKALAGKSIGVVALGTAGYYYAKLMLAAAGMGTNAVSYASTTADPATIVSALQSGKVIASVAPLSAALGLVNIDHDTVLFDMDTTTASFFPGKVPTPNDLSTGAPLKSIANLVHQYLWTTKSWANSHAKLLHAVQLSLMETDIWLHNPANASSAVEYLVSANQVTTFPGETPAQVRTFAKETLPLIVSYVPESNVATYQKVYATNGVLPTSVPVSKFFAASTPQSPKGVVSQVRAAGLGSLGNTA